MARRPTPRPSPARMRGQPVVMLVLVLGGWSLLRAATWVSPIAPPLVDLPQVSVSVAQATKPAEPAPRGLPDQGSARSVAAPLPVAPWPMLRPPPAPLERLAPPAAPGATTQRMAAGHALLMAAGFARMELPPQLAAWFNARTPGAPASAPAAVAVESRAALLPAPPISPAAPAPARRASRWTADGWLLWRDDTTTPLASGRPSYGRSQVGAVARYSLAPTSNHRPQAYLRAAAALQGAREEEAALGLSARPLAHVPVRVAAELRASQRVDGTQLRPAVYAVTELPAQSLPLGASAEAYAQAGYVGGQAHTAFVDGQVRVDRSVVRHDDFDLRAGGGAWGGAQRGSARLDVGPSASVTFAVGEARGRLAADYRFRVAGDAEPASGPAITLSAGF